MKRGKPGKRRPGPGRRPLKSGGKTAIFSTRITAETRAALEKEALGSRLTISRLVDLYIQDGLRAAQERSRWNDRSIRALGHFLWLIDDFTRRVSPEALNKINDDDFAIPEEFLLTWRNDAYTFEAFRVAANLLLEKLRPAGEVTTRVDEEGARRSAAEWGALHFSYVWREIN